MPVKRPKDTLAFFNTLPKTARFRVIGDNRTIWIKDTEVSYIAESVDNKPVSNSPRFIPISDFKAVEPV